ncbi:GNAT family N-acetyltransferase [Streptomyces sp. NPDC059456]|uniref:GNAT family N-acetyltransferase n=1 Tax=Streptomyces sp. NPDC059456 TaxID=3346838 RepID=UPI0036841F8F
MQGLEAGMVCQMWARPRHPEVRPTFLELGYGVVTSRRGRGYTTEATRALAAFALAAPAVQAVAIGVERSNLPSVRVLEKAGFERCTVTAEEAEGVARFASPGTTAPAGRRPGPATPQLTCWFRPVAPSDQRSSCGEDGGSGGAVQASEWLVGIFENGSDRNFVNVMAG